VLIPLELCLNHYDSDKPEGCNEIIKWSLTMVLPTLIGREMRSAARQPFSYHLRVLGAGTLLAVGIVAVAEGSGELAKGGPLFARLHATLLGAIWCLVPLLTADCISRERREHTLPLLFLTPLRPWHIVLAKGMTHGLRAMTLWLSVLPVLAIPFIAGGVGWREAVLSVLLGFSSICLAMGAGLLASTGSPVRLRAVVLAACLGLVFFLGFLMELGFLVSGGGVTMPFAYSRPMSSSERFGFGLQLALDSGACWQLFLGSAIQPWLVRSGYVTPAAPLGTNLPLLLNVGIVALTGLISLVLLIGLAAWNVRRIWHENPLSERAIRVQRRLLSPLYFKGTFQRWMRFEMNHNPIGWLQHRTWSARLVTWIWFAVFACIYSSLLGNVWVYQRAFHPIQSLLAWSLVVSVAIGSAGSFRRERETGLLELLIVSPVREWQIIAGRLRGIWQQFLPAMVLLVTLWLFCASLIARDLEEGASVLFFASTFLTLPVIGLYNSLSRASFASAFVSTLVMGVVLPEFLARVDEFVSFFLLVLGQINGFHPSATPLRVIPFQLGVAGVCAWRFVSQPSAARVCFGTTGSVSGASEER
jgi:ABC-type transport system involved in multi-copper enzyme maturation permease subunit